MYFFLFVDEESGGRIVVVALVVGYFYLSAIKTAVASSFSAAVATLGEHG